MKKEGLITKDFMSIDTDIEVDQENLPDSLKEDCKELEQFFEEGDKAGFSGLLEAVEATMHYCVAIHEMNEAQYYQITGRYGLGRK